MFYLFQITLLILCCCSYHQDTMAVFNRSCLNFEDCVFYNEETDLSSSFNDPGISFVCKLDKATGTGTCVCQSAVSVLDQPLWNLTWTEDNRSRTIAEDEFERESERYGCQIGPNGPCGIDNGLSVHCSAEFNCINNRCRREKELRKLPVGTLCHDTVECEDGLKCILTKWKYFYSESQCLPGSSDKGLDFKDAHHPLF